MKSIMSGWIDSAFAVAFVLAAVCAATAADPAVEMDPDTFSVRWTGFLEPEFSETYTLYTVSDDGIRLSIDGRMVIDNWTEHGPTEDKSTIELVAGRRYPIKLEFYEYGGWAVARLLWSSPSRPKEVIPEGRLFPPEGEDGNGLRGEYFDEMDLTGAALVRRDAVVSFEWGGGSPTNPDANVAGGQEVAEEPVYPPGTLRWMGPGTTVGLKGGPRVHIVQGPWSHHWKLTQTLMDSWEVGESFMTSSYGWRTALKGFPSKKEDLFAYRALIVGNVPLDAFGNDCTTYQDIHPVPGRSEAWVEEFLMQGGGVWVLGGNNSLGTMGNFQDGKFLDLTGTRFEAFLPVVTHGNFGNLKSDEQKKPLALTPVGTHPILEGVDWSDKPVTMYYNDVKPKPDAQVLVKAGDAPVLVAGTYKGGRIVVWVATLHGEPPQPDRAYWRWAGWPKLAKNIATWITGEKPDDGK